MRTTIITPAEADTFLAQYSNWLVLTNDAKLAHIAKACVYVQTYYTCTEIDWTDDLTISEVIKEAIAYFAYADSAGNLFGDVTSSDESKGRLKSVKNILEDMEDVTQWYSSGALNRSMVTRSLSYPDVLMKTECTITNTGRTLVRN